MKHDTYSDKCFSLVLRRCMRQVINMGIIHNNFVSLNVQRQQEGERNSSGYSC